MIVADHRALSLCLHVMTLRFFAEQLALFLLPSCEFSVVWYSEELCRSTRRSCSHGKATPCCRHRNPFSSLPAKAVRDLARSICDLDFLITNILMSKFSPKGSFPLSVAHFMPTLQLNFSHGFQPYIRFCLRVKRPKSDLDQHVRCFHAQEENQI